MMSINIVSDVLKAEVRASTFTLYLLRTPPVKRKDRSTVPRPQSSLQLLTISSRKHHTFLGITSRHLPTGHWPGDDDEVPLDGNCCQGKYRHRSRKTDSERVKNATWNTDNPENFKRKILEIIYLILLLPRDVGS
ncbi:unnamed protein product [Nesidiocoris tenuis]|uniref:Uncharacterized protein n=1 Tax=Nesidiocoris tenuis TaxID=355587 RepID=A0A6H5H1U6_9HEMI|nr:unnamed protein product [Nesidiocoris tenuis]